MTSTQCIAVTKSGIRCSRNAVKDGYCEQHYKILSHENIKQSSSESKTGQNVEIVKKEGIHSGLYTLETVVDGVTRYRETRRNGIKVKEENFNNDGKENGPQHGWYLNKSKEYTTNYFDGKLNGIQRGWWPNGNKEYEINYEDGKANGTEIGWDENGVEKYRNNYVNGVLSN
jgi:antitoxin component YwqK of YwqJK toxin-antitoxin module